MKNENIFNQIFIRQSTINKHLNAPLLQERLEYLNYCASCHMRSQTVQDIARFLLMIVESLNLEAYRVVTVKEIETVIKNWLPPRNKSYKKSAFSIATQTHFVKHAINWLENINWLEKPIADITLFNQLFEIQKIIKKHIYAPLLKERLIYLHDLIDNGASQFYTRRIANYLLVIIDSLDFYELRLVSMQEIIVSADNWQKKQNFIHSNNITDSAKKIFIRTAVTWFDIIGCLKKELVKKFVAFQEYLDQYVEYMRKEQGLSENTIIPRYKELTELLNYLNNIKTDFIKITPLTIDKFLIKKHDIDGCSRATVQERATVIRSFLRFAESKEWCQKHLADSIKAPRVYKHESLPSSPSWDDVKKILASCNDDYPTNIRDYAILMLLSVYGLRCNEVIHLCLDDIDWNNELIQIRRAKNSKPQIFPLSHLVGEAILNYIKNVRPNKGSLREVFLCMDSPYRAFKSHTLYGMITKRLKPFNLNIKHHGPHSLRHACATYLINEGISLKAIGDHLGHANLDTTQIYAHVDLTSLRKVCDGFIIRDLL